MGYLIDMSCINAKNIGASVPSYIIKLVDAFYSNGISDVSLLADSSLVRSFSQRYPKYKIYPIKRNFFLYRIPIITDIYGRYTYKQTLSKIKCDVVFIASDQDRGSIASISQKKIVVFHDLKGVKTKSKSFNSKNLHFYKTLAYQAVAIIAISQFTKNDLFQYLSISEDKIHVVPNSVSLPKNSVEIEGLPDKYILYVNTLLPHKNIQTLINAYSECCFRDNYKLVVVGKDTLYWKKSVYPLITQKKLEQNIIHLQNLSREELRFVYEKASLFVTTSLHEGFGYTPIEAALCRVPVICSTSEALKDSTQGLANYYEPADDHSELAKMIEQVIKNPPSKERLNFIAEKFEKDYSADTQLKEIISILNTYN